MKVKLFGLTATALLAHSISAHSALIELDLRASGEWYRQYVDETQVNDWDTYYYQLEVPDLFGTMLIDNTRTDASALIDSNFYFGNHHWSGPIYGTSEEEGRTVFRFNTDGTLLDFFLPTSSFSEFGDDDRNIINVASHGFSEMSLGLGDSEWFYCEQNCFSITQTIDGVPVVPVSDVPEPATLALLGIGSLGLVFSRRRKNLRANR